MTMNEQMRIFARRSFIRHCVAEIQYGFDMRFIRQHEPGTGQDHVVKLESGPVMKVEGGKGIGLGPLRIEDGQDVGDAARTVMAKLFKSPDGEERGKGSFHVCIYGID